MAKRTANARAAAIPARTFGAAGPKPQSALPAASEVCGRLWELCGPHPPAGYRAPWDGPARDLRDRLSSALEEGAALRAAAPASRLDYAPCVRALLRGAPVVHRAMVEIRGLALSAEPEPAPEPPKRIEVVPGMPLVYELLIY